jgi:glycolate oxidase FAD binding subunit
VKVLPLPACETSLGLEASEAAALERMNLWAGQPLPVSATAWHRGVLRVRLSGSEPAVRAAERSIGGSRLAQETFWHDLREHRHPFFAGPEPLWRVALPSDHSPLALPGDTFIEWGGALRWVRADGARALAAKAGGHATLFRSEGRQGVFAPLEGVNMDLHRRLKAAFDPAGILNPGRLYPEL